MLLFSFLTKLQVGQMVVWQYGGEEEMRWIGNFLPFFLSAAVFGVRRVVVPTRAVNSVMWFQIRGSCARYFVRRCAGNHHVGGVCEDSFKLMLGILNEPQTSLHGSFCVGFDGTRWGVF